MIFFFKIFFRRSENKLYMNISFGLSVFDLVRILRVFHDPWLPRVTSFIPITSGAGMVEKVSSLILPESCSWDVAKVDQLFLSVDKEAIFSIPLSVRGLRIN
ncbi:hypothetical protein Ddye_031573 [Dipteronia dyeriana]|uniref:Uncharacterized protein n=1 Tax=Dipteronia dyeriana TaxID=168575 RepID=A0AAD9WMQ7_9ROSI|nr:hypothetical protein Ddye_031573 [Dipteronia dyeriana]